MQKAIRAGHTLQTLAGYQKSTREFIKTLREKGTKAAFQQRDEKWGDYRTAKNKKKV